MKKRIEEDTIGKIEVAEDALWGAQTQRSFENFPQGVETMPLSLLKAIVYIKKACAEINFSEDRLSEEKRDLIVYAANQIIFGHYDDQFPLTIWQTGSGTQTNMNVNEVIAHIANKKNGKSIIHPNDDVNMSQSSNDVFPTAMHISSVLNLKENLY
ncbi:MAG: lyase family protein, partial [Anaerococcus sp.]|uniref:lyase family protein n=1 Tax=Anaerococcus sp. TaxID=1872515 RepID=UPI0028FF21BA